MPKSTILAVILLTIVATAGCKKTSPVKDPTTDPVAVVPLPDSAMFVSLLNINADNQGSTTYVLNASNGQVTNQYRTPYDAKTTWVFPAAGNGLLYNLKNNKIDALELKTGALLWTDTVDNFTVPLLHDNVFYGISRTSSNTYEVYALDATKPSKTFLWKYKATGETTGQFPFYYNSAVNHAIDYYNGTLYVSANRTNLTALDPKTGVVKWSISAAGVALYSLAAINNGIISAGNTAIDANTGTKIAIVNPVIIPLTYGPTTSQQATLEFATKDLYFVKTIHFSSDPGFSTSFLSAIDKTTGAEKWRKKAGNGYINFDTVTYVDQFVSNQLITKTIGSQGAGKYGVIHGERYGIIDLVTGAVKVNFDDNGKGSAASNIIVNNTIYFNNNFQGLGPMPVPLVNYLYAIDMATGKQKWNNDKLLAGYIGNAYSCIYASGKGFSPFIQ